MALKSGRVGIHPSQVDPITGMLLSGPSGSTNYNDLSNKPQINGVTLSGNKTTSDLHIEAGASDLSDLDDVTISNPEAGQLLIYDGDKWENQFASISPVTPATLASLQDVEITDPEDGEYLTYDSVSGKWINSGEAPAPTYTDLTATIYGAVEDTISFTDAAGIPHSEVFASGQSSKSVTFKINPSGSTSITFTSAIAKNPDDLTADYSKSITITDATTEVYVMPDNALYWYGYQSSNLESNSTANGWSNSRTFVEPIYNSNNIEFGPTATSTYSGVGNKNSISPVKVSIIAHGVTASNNKYSTLSSIASKNIANVVAELDVTSSNTEKLDMTSNQPYFSYGAPNTRKSKLYALWYE